MKKTRRIFMMVVLAMAVIGTIITGCKKESEGVNIRWNRNEFGYASDLQFNFRFVENGVIHMGNETDSSVPSMLSTRLNPEREWYTGFYTDIVIVHNEEEAVALPDNVVAAWPQEDLVDGLIKGLHWAVSLKGEDLLFRGHMEREEITLEEFGLTYPITATDLVDNWEKVNALWRALTTSEKSTILRAMPHGGVRVSQEDTDAENTTTSGEEDME